MAGGQGVHSSHSLPTPAKVQAELDAVVGRMRTPRLEDRKRLPYTNSVLHEIQRLISVLPLGLPRALTRDTHLRGYFLPKVPTKHGDSVRAWEHLYLESSALSMCNANSQSPGSRKEGPPSHWLYNGVLDGGKAVTNQVPGGYPCVPPHQGTFVIPLLVSSHRDPTQFKDPNCFNPTNFLDDKGNFQSNDAFMPFAPGLGQEGRGQGWAGPQRHGAHPASLCPQESGCAWVQAWRDGRSSSSSPPSCSASACSLWGVPATSTSPRSALAWATSPQPSSSA